VLAHCTMYAEDALVPVAAAIRAAPNPARELLQEVRRKEEYESVSSFPSPFLATDTPQASVYMRHWALTHWTEGVAVNLPADLLDRASIRLALRACGGSENAVVSLERSATVFRMNSTAEL
jgi:hypothetical protein